MLLPNLIRCFPKPLYIIKYNISIQNLNLQKRSSSNFTQAKRSVFSWEKNFPTKVANKSALMVALLVDFNLIIFTLN